MGLLLSSAAISGQLPSVSVGGKDVFKFILSTVLGVAGMFLLAYGKKMNDVEKMIMGGVLTIASLFFF